MIYPKNSFEYVEVTDPDAKGASIKKMISPKEGWEGFVMRELTVEPDGYTPKHAHPWPHINYILKGSGTLELDGEIKEVSLGDSAYIPSNAMHQFKNASDEPFVFICIVPEEGHK